jgi:hypothetical protein
MGEANQRGTYEERKAKAIIRIKAEYKEWVSEFDARQKERKANMTPEERQKANSQAYMGTVAALAAGLDI